MIQQATAQNTLLFETVPQNHPAVGPLLAVNWQLAAQNPRMPYQFYLVGNEALLQVSGASAVLCGIPQDSAELQSFFAFLGIRQLTSTGWVPAGWQATCNTVMLRQPATSPPLCPVEAPAVDFFPPMEDIVALLETDPAFPPTLRDNLYADACIRRNHGCAAFLGIWQQGKLVSTAGATALTATHALLANLYTYPAHRGKGYASLLITSLCHTYAGRQIALCCHPRLKSFYTPFGFLAAQSCFLANPDNS